MTLKEASSMVFFDFSFGKTDGIMIVSLCIFAGFFIAFRT